MLGRGPFPPAVWPVGLFGALPITAAAGAPFDRSPIVDPRIYQEPGSLHITWKSTAPAGSWYQVYLNGRLAWVGRKTYLDLPFKAVPGERIHVDIGTVGPDVRNVDFSYLLALPSNRAQLNWDGGRYLDLSLRGFHIYMSRSPGLPYDPTNLVGDVKAAPGGVWADGFGAGPFGAGGFGADQIPYQWVSRPLTTGVWQFAVASYDVAGDEDASPPTRDVSITVPPPEVAARPDGSRLWIESYDVPTNTYTLAWTPMT